MDMPSLPMYLLGFLLVLGPLIFFHELGHYAVGRWFGVKATSFAMGFGPEIAGWTDKRGTRWKLCALPLGGYVQFAGDMSPTGQSDDSWHSLPSDEREKTFQSKALWKRALIVLAGPMANFLLAIAILTGFSIAFGRGEMPPVVAGFAEISNAEKAGLKVGDKITHVDGVAVDDFVDIREAVITRPGENMQMTVSREGNALDFSVPIATQIERDRFGNEFRIGMLGIRGGEGRMVPVPWYQAPVYAVGDTVNIIKMTMQGMGQIITGRRPLSELGGPVKIAKFSGEQFSLGWLNLLNFIVFVSINLGFINLMPVPMLDGGHLAFYAAEAVRKRPISARGQEWALRGGMALVLAMMVFVTINDFASLGIFNGIFGS